jgi:hypothetical protein
MAEKNRLSSRGRTSEGTAKRRLRSIKRESGPAKQGKPIRAAAGQRKASRGTRLRAR